jgi:membrane protease YdiL (CAAX protease family)
MKNKKEFGDIVLFLALAFGISWTTGFVIFLTGGLVNSPEIIKGSGVTLALILLASVYMWGPAIAHIILRIVKKISWRDANLKLNFKAGWPFWITGWLAPGLLTLFGTGIFFLVFPEFFDPKLTLIAEQLKMSAGNNGPIQPFNFMIMQILLALFAAPLLNLLATFGEEFGWRGFLVPALAKYDRKKALILSGLIWGLWHWPVILMGHNYGLNYPGYPWPGLLLTLWVFISFGVLFGWLALKAGSVWPAVFAHGSLNGTAAIGLLFIKGNYSTLLGPTPAGLIGCLPFTLFAIIVLFTTKENTAAVS